MTERAPIQEAAKRLGVSPDTIRRRMKKGELVGEKEPTPQGYEWRLILAEEEDDVTTPQGESSPSLASVAIEVELLRERLDDLKAERDAWREQAQRSSEAERELRILLRQAQELALPAKATPQDAPNRRSARRSYQETRKQRRDGWLASGSTFVANRLEERD